MPVNMRVPRLAKTLDVMAASDAARSGVLKYSYAGTVSCSMYSPAASESRSYAVIDASADAGRMSAVFIEPQL